MARQAVRFLSTKGLTSQFVDQRSRRWAFPCRFPWTEYGVSNVCRALPTHRSSSTMTPVSAGHGGRQKDRPNFGVCPGQRHRHLAMIKKLRLRQPRRTVRICGTAISTAKPVDGGRGRVAPADSRCRSATITDASRQTARSLQGGAGPTVPVACPWQRPIAVNDGQRGRRLRPDDQRRQEVAGLPNSRDRQFLNRVSRRDAPPPRQKSPRGYRALLVSSLVSSVCVRLRSLLFGSMRRCR